jgi:hypothetical protein
MSMKVAARLRGYSTRKKREFRFTTPHLRAAQVSAGKLFDRVECFPPERWRELEGFGPRILVGHSAELQSFAEHVKGCGIEFPSLDRAIFVATQFPDKPLDDVVRLVLWKTFGVPIYEVYIAPDGSPLCYECEAHEGWHAQEGIRLSAYRGELVLFDQRRRLHTGLMGEIEGSRCPCGRPGARVINVREPVQYPSLEYRLSATA